MMHGAEWSFFGMHFVWWFIWLAIIVGAFSRTAHSATCSSGGSLAGAPPGRWVGRGPFAKGDAAMDVAWVLAPCDAMIKALTPAQIQHTAGQFFNMANYVRVVLLPEGNKPVP